MKLRLKGNSIRLRLTRSEVEAIGSGGEVRETVDLGTNGGAFVYSLSVSPDAADVEAVINGNQLAVTLPENEASRWAGSERVGIEGEQAASEGRVLRILVEKDFECLAERPFEDDSDAYPNPRAAAV